MTRSADFSHPALEAVLRTARQLTGMEVVYIASLDDGKFVAERLDLGSEWPGVVDGLTVPVADALCARLLAGARSSATTDAPHDPAYASSPVVADLGVRSYVGVPVLDEQGRLLATLCGIDRGEVAVPEQAVAVLQELAGTVGALVAPDPCDGLVIQRRDSGWEVRDPDRPVETTADLTSAMVLADLLAGELGAPARPRRPEAPLDELGQLRLAVEQLEHALAARVVVEQAIGVLTERQHHTPREAFERLRKVARSRGRKVHDLAREVVLSAQDAAVPLPPELAGRR